MSGNRILTTQSISLEYFEPKSKLYLDKTKDIKNSLKSQMKETTPKEDIKVQ